MQYKQIVFDIDGTLIDTEYAVLHSLQDTIKITTGRDAKIEELYFALGITGYDALVQLEIPDTTFALDIWDKNMRKYMDSVKVFEGMLDVLKKLEAGGYKVGIVTSKTKEEFEHDFSVFGINDYFETVVCADDTAEHKPNAEPLLKYIELAKCSKEEAIYIGDSVYDKECAHNAGVDFALAGWGAKNMFDNVIILNKPFDILQHVSGVSFLI